MGGAFSVPTEGYNHPMEGRGRQGMVSTNGGDPVPSTGGTSCTPRPDRGGLSTRGPGYPEGGLSVVPQRGSGRPGGGVAVSPTGVSGLAAGGGGRAAGLWDPGNHDGEV